MSVYDKAIPREEEKKVAAKMVEMLSLLTMVKPLCNPRLKITDAQQDILLETLNHVGNLVRDAQKIQWDARYPKEAEDAPKLLRHG